MANEYSIDELRRAAREVLERRLFPPPGAEEGFRVWCARISILLIKNELKMVLLADAGGLDGSHAINELVLQARLRDARENHQLADRTATDDHAAIRSDLARQERAERRQRFRRRSHG